MNRKLRVEELNRPDLETFKLAEKLPVTIVLDGLRSHHNVGAVFRTSDAFAFEEVLLCGITPVPPHREINKTALGATESVHWKYQESSRDAVKLLKEKGHRILALEQAQESIMLQDLAIDSTEPIALVLGNEVFGVSQSVIDLCDAVVEIPQEGTKHSLNVSVSAGMIMWTVYNALRN